MESLSAVECLMWVIVNRNGAALALMCSSFPFFLSVPYSRYSGNEQYEGQWVYGKREGDGRFTYADGAVYDGQWVDDRIHGQGTSVFASGNKCGGGRPFLFRIAPQWVSYWPELFSITI